MPHPPRIDTTAACLGNCDASPPSYPVIDSLTAFGDVTTYGSVSLPAPSLGGACNYGETQVMQFAAIQVNQLPGDLRGQWNGGRMCGQCVEVSARTPTGWKSTVVRIMDKCPDANCGIDLGGAPAQLLMGDQPGRYSGKWTLVSCDGHPEVSDGPPALYVKEGSNAFWSLVQVRNPAQRIQEIRVRKQRDTASTAWNALPWATEAENFFKVDPKILQDPGAYVLEVLLPDGKGYTATLKGSALAAEKTSIALSPLP